MYIVIEEFRGLGFLSPVERVEITVFSNEENAVLFFYASHMSKNPAYIIEIEEGETTGVYAK